MSYLKICSILLVCANLQTTLLAQVVLKTNLFYPVFVKGGSLALEVATHANTSLSVYGAFGSSGRLAFAKDYSFQNLIVEKRYYKPSSKPKLQGLYLAAYAKYMHRKIYKEGLTLPFFILKGRDFDGHSVGIGVGVGAQRNLSKRLMLDFFVSSGYLVYVDQVDYQNPQIYRSGHLDLRTGLCVGYRF